MYRRTIIVLSIVCALLLTAVVPAMAQSATATPQPATPALTASTDFYATSNFRANVRSGPGVAYTVIGQLKQGDSVDITGRNSSNSWVRINFNGQEGWVSFGLVEITGDIDSAPVAEAGANAVLRETASDANNAKLGDVVVVTRLNANLRDTPSTDGNVLSTIPFGTNLTVIGRTDRNNWVRVTYNGQTGWVSSGVLRFTQGNLANTPVVDAAGVVIVAPKPETTPNP